MSEDRPTHADYVKSFLEERVQYLERSNKELREALEAFDIAAKESKSIIGFAGKAMALLKQARAALSAADAKGEKG